MTDETKTDYKATLNLPSTAFAMRANLAKREPQMLSWWESNDIYAKVEAAGKGRKRFTLLDGPPYANAQIHIGHALNKVLKDIVVKSRRLDGYDSPYVPGWDCHGLPIEHQIEKKLKNKKKKRTDIDESTFRQMCREHAMSQVATQRTDFRRLGVLGKWDQPYLTMQPNYEAEQLRAFAKIIENGHLYKGYKPVHWCLDCRSSLAEAEVEYQDKRSPTIDVLFAADDEQTFAAAFAASGGLGGEGPVGIAIWTTTPWTLPGNQAVAVHAELVYAAVQFVPPGATQANRIVLAQVMVEDIMARYGVTDYQVVGTCTGQALNGVRVRHPFYQRIVPIITGEHVTTEAGTGAVHTAPGHGQEDFQAGLEHGLAVDNPVGPDGCFVPGTPLVEGQFVHKANANIIEILREHHVLLMSSEVEHSYPHCWRHKSPVIFRATPQWFIGMESAGLRRQTLAKIPSVDWIPDWGQARITGMIDGRPDWCISRQRSWGVPIALFTHKHTDELHPRTSELLDKVASLVEQDGINAWFDLDASQLLGDEANDYVKVTDVMDVWIDSGLAHHCVAGFRDEVGTPADLVLEGSDQHRGWFQSSLLTSIAMYGRAPYKAVLTHGFTVDERGHKMSKSVGNTTAPQEVWNREGADVLRLWVAATDYRGELSISTEILKRISDSYRRIRNTARFLLGNLQGFDPAEHTLAVSEMLSLDAWVVARAQQLHEEIAAAYERYEFHNIYQKLHNFCITDLGGFYLDIIKDRLYTTDANSRARRSAQSAMQHVLEMLVRWLTPILSFTAEEIWQLMPGEREESVMLAQWYSLPATGTSALDWERIVQVRDAVARELERLRDEGDIGSSLEASVSIFAPEPLYNILAPLGDELHFVLITSEASLGALADKPDDASDVSGPVIGELWVSAHASAHGKCARCWHRCEDVGKHPEHADICGRCISNISGEGEVREHA